MLQRLSFFVALTVASTALAGPADKRLDLYWIDVEGGAATLLVTPAGETVLIDTGNPGRRDPDERLQHPLQWRLWLVFRRGS